MKRSTCRSISAAAGAWLWAASWGLMAATIRSAATLGHVGAGLNSPK
jgi:hypothetical protein